MLYPQINYIYCSNQFEQYKMSYTAWGNPETCIKTLLCVHGMNRNSRDFDFIGQHFAKKGYYVIAPDIVGRGNSDYLINQLGYDIPYYVNDVLLLINTLKLKNISFIGTSMGGIIGMGLASLPINPIRSLILNDIGAEIELSGLLRIAKYSVTCPVFQSFDAALQQNMKDSKGFGDLPYDIWEFMTRVSYQINNLGQYVQKHDVKIGLQAAISFSPTQNFVLWNFWDLIKTPTLIIRGENSDILSISTVKKMQTSNTNTRYVEIANTGHAPYLYSDTHLAMLDEFL